MVAALGSADASYLRVGSLGGIKHLQPLSTSGQFQNNVYRSLPYGGMIGRLNSPASLGVHGLPSSGILQLGHAQNLNNNNNNNNSINEPLNFQSSMVSVNQNQNGGSLQGMPVSVGLDQLQPNKVVTSVQVPTTGFDDKTTSLFSNKLPDPAARVSSSCSRPPLVGIGTNGFLLEPNSQDTHGGRGYENLPSVASQQHSEFSLPLMDNHNGRCNDNWPSAVQSSGMPTNSYPTGDCLHGGNPSGASSITSLSTRSHDSLADMQSHGPIFTNNSTPNVAYQGWDDHSLDSLIPVNGAVGASGLHRNLDYSYCGNPLEMKHEGFTKPAHDPSLKPSQGYNIMDLHRPQRSQISSNVGSLEDLVSSMMKQVITFD